MTFGEWKFCVLKPPLSVLEGAVNLKKLFIGHFFEFVLVQIQIVTIFWILNDFYKPNLHIVCIIFHSFPSYFWYYFFKHYMRYYYITISIKIYEICKKFRFRNGPKPKIFRFFLFNHYYALNTIEIMRKYIFVQFWGYT